MSERPWFYPACVAGFVLWTMIVGSVSEQRGYLKATKEAADRDAFASEQMAKVGFCGWLKATNFATECARRPTPSE